MALTPYDADISTGFIDTYHQMKKKQLTNNIQ
jgi:hypothetical protein